MRHNISKLVSERRAAEDRAFLAEQRALNAEKKLSSLYEWVGMARSALQKEQRRARHAENRANKLQQQHGKEVAARTEAVRKKRQYAIKMAQVQLELADAKKPPGLHL